MSRTGKQSWYQSPAAAVIAVIVIAVGGWLAYENRTRFGADPNPPPPVRATPIPGGTPGADPTRPEEPVTLVVDGWSTRIASHPTGPPAEFVVSVDGEPANASWVPVTATDVDRWLTTSPDSVARLAARLVTADPTLRCGPAGCTTSDGHPINLDALHTVPDSGVLADWESGGAITVTVTARPGARITVSADGFTPVTIDPSSVGKATVVPVAAGFGQLFELRPQWLDDGTADSIRFPLTGIVSEPAVPDQPALIGGPAVAAPDARTLTAQQLTAWSSPTTGCGPGMVCTPDPVPLTVTMGEVSWQAVTDASSLDGDRNPVAVAFVIYQGTFTATLPAAAASPHGQGPLPAGTVATAFSVVEMYDRDGLVAVAGGQGTTAAQEWDGAAVLHFLGADRFSPLPADYPLSPYEPGPDPADHLDPFPGVPGTPTPSGPPVPVGPAPTPGTEVWEDDTVLLPDPGDSGAAPPSFDNGGVLIPADPFEVGPPAGDIFGYPHN